MKHFTLFLIAILASFNLLFSQAPPKQWDFRFGGSGSDVLESLKQTSDGGYILGGSSSSMISGDKTQATQGLTGSNDYWIVKVNSIGIKEWDARFGGNGIDNLFQLQQTSDGGYILGGNSNSEISGDKTQGTQGGVGDHDYWIVKVNSSGVKQWDARFGGSLNEDLQSIQQTSDGGYILGGSSSSSISGDKTQPSRGSNDYWIVKVSSIGTKQWDARFGGFDNDYLYEVRQTSDGGYILGGHSYSGISGDKTQGSQGSSDYWIVKVNSIGAKEWDFRFGGDGTDLLDELVQTNDLGYILGGHSTSGLSGDKTQGSQGGVDYWIVKVSSSGVKQWDARFGGTGNDLLISLEKTIDGGYLLGGNSYSDISGDKTQASQGDADYWILKVNSNGVKQWDGRFGGSAFESQESFQQTSDGGYIIAGNSESGISGDKSQASQGAADYWIVKLLGLQTNSITGSPFCAGTNVNVPYTVSSTLNIGNIFTAQLSDASGSFASPIVIGTLSSTTSGSINATIPLSTTAGANYRIRVVSNDPAIIGSDNGSDISILSPQITTNAITGSPFCSGSAVNIPFSIGSCNFSNSNIFTAQLSNSSGSFTSPTNIGTLTSATAGTINGIIPATTTSGTAYRIRVVGSDPLTIGSDNGSNISIQPLTTNLFLETIGTTIGTVSVASYESSNGFDNDNFTMTGTNATVDNTTPSSGYAGASGLATVLIDPVISSFFQIADINTLNSSNIQLSFGVKKGNNAADGSQLVVEVSSDGINYIPLSFTLFPTGAGTSAVWYYRTAIGTIPQAANLRIRFRQLSSTIAWRIDDIKLIASDLSSGITASGLTNLCPPATVTLSATNAQSYLWSNNEATQSILTSVAGNYYCSMTSTNGCVFVSNTIDVTSATPTPFNVTGGGIYCASGPSLTVALSGSQPGVNYQLRLNNVDAGSPIAGTGNAVSFGNQTGVGTYTVIATNISPSCTNTMNGNAVISSASIFTNTITGSPFCSGTTVNIPFSISCPHNNGNIFTAELSDASGSFVSPTVIGTLTSTSSGTINATIPSNTTVGLAYRIRVVSSDPAIIGSDNGTDISIQTFSNNIFIETMGTSVSSVSVATFEASNGFDNVTFTMSGTNATVDNSTPSTGYTGASGLGSVTIASVTNAFFEIAGINTLTSINMALSFGIRKSSNNSDASSLALDVSSDGISYSPLTFPLLPTGNGTGGLWYFRTASGAIPQAANLRIRFKVLGNFGQFKIDDLKLIDTNSSPGIIASGSTILCAPATVTLNATNSQSYLWSTGAVTQNIITSNAGNYYCTLTSSSGCSFISNTIVVSSITPVSFDVTGGGLYCPFGTPVTVGLIGSQTGVTYQLKFNGVDLGPPVAGNGNPISFGNQTAAGTYTVSATNVAANCTSAMNGNAVITIFPCPLAGIYCIGPDASYTPPSGPAYINGNSPYPTLTAAVNSLNLNGASSHVIFEFQNNYSSVTETFPISITYQGTPTTTAVFRPRSDISSLISIVNPNTSGTSVIAFDGADYVTFDGSPGGTMGTSVNLMVRSTLSVGVANAHVISFINDAMHNIINAIQVEGSIYNYGIYFSTTTLSNGNDFNTIQNCIIRNRSDNNNGDSPQIGIYSKGTGTGSTCNNNNLIQNNRIFNFSETGIHINADGNNGKWDIIGNHIYSTFTLPYHNMIFVQPTDTSTITISNNYIGGTAPFAGGAPLPLEIDFNFKAIYVILSNTSPGISIISNNVIKNMAVTGGLNSLSYTGISVQSGWAIITNNIIGDPLVLNDINLASSAGIQFRGIEYSSSQNNGLVNFNNNSINNIFFQNSTTAGTTVNCFKYTNSNLTTGDVSISENRIKNFSYAGKSSFTCMYVTGFNGRSINITDNKFESINLSNNAGLAFTGIILNSGAANIFGNRIGKYENPNDILIAGINSHCGIIASGTVGMINIQNDTIVNLTSTNGNDNTVQLNGITIGTSVFAHTISDNLILNLSTASIKSSILSNNSSEYALTGILVSSSTNSSFIIENIISGLHITTTSSSANPIVAGLGIMNGADINVNSNRIYDLTNTATNTATYPTIIGVRTSFPTNNYVSYQNNMIALSNGIYTNGVGIYGFYEYSTTPFLTYYYNNSVAISGNTTNAPRSAAFNVASPIPLTGAPFIRSNIFHNTRTGGTGKNYSISNQFVIPNWNQSQITSDYNDLYSADISTLGYWGGDKTFASWKTASGGDTHSKNSIANFIDINSDLHLSPFGNCNLNGTGANFVSFDIDNQMRNIPTSDIGCDEFTLLIVPEICNGFDDDCDGLVDEGCPVTLNLKLFIEGYYTGGGLMNNHGQGGHLFIIGTPNALPTDMDTVVVSAMNAFSPYAEVDHKSAVLQTDGNMSVVFGPAVLQNNNYYLKITHQNSIETWSKNPVLFSSVTSYDFSLASTQAYDDGFNLPMKLVDVNPYRWAIFNGDVTHDGTVDSQDMTIEEAASNSGNFGDYPTDLNGDGGSDALDMTIIENNSNIGIFVAHP